MSQTLAIIDFHSHHVPASWPLATLSNFPASQRERWERINARLADAGALTQGIDTGDIAGRVVNIPTALFTPGRQVPAADTFRKVNDQVAAITAAQPGRLHGIASVDAFGGEAAANELVRAVRSLGLRGVFLESEQDGRLLDAPEARPVLTAAAELGIAVFAHPVNPKGLTEQLARYGQVGTLFARGTINAAALIALVEGGVFDALPGLRVAFTNLAIGGLLHVRSFGRRAADGQTDIGVLLRRHVYIDTMGFDPVLIRAAADIVGVDHVLAGSDWPIVSDEPISRRLAASLTAAGFDPTDQQKIAGGNTRTLLGL
ncbi:amidohydrolase [Bradyrhizobium sp. U87765 SZCCT0131]|uniref:amidohydrolase family protein n=1 Tax=unclassified Bradyrhizobium TaxID=2631580 RepID=UPI001BAB7110|nr:MULTISPECIES: amidohydrolase family protein [unclassified Bradyrhizobium]MBR1222996.1 amidohydrolase [Bradyrhizobium sp. U87765 SZCCT0131]MBR1262732.1 amidohydrolase [Bradyrhizobium sp. U87765 SZCCT0134]MBR1308796.1 amidohydrolase [Bradyrhizobium sp. U87765 SZCCT0110]MBR1318514.1 amidohydrolase [Bradyrhizobium sp. U87765 SZCCT0109]MBR1352218.1 amidohydrolase [Bradyrhizobium sp. U87765 SZCCT0048]